MLMKGSGKLTLALLLVMALSAACTKQAAPPAPAATAPAANSQAVTQEERGTSTPDKKYAKFIAMSSMGPVVPGLVQGLVPQGLAYWPEQDWLVVSYYTKAAQPSALAVVDVKTGKLVKSLRMYEAEGRPYMGHAGGVAVSKASLWMGSEGDMFRMTLKDLQAAPDGGKIIFADHYRMETNASFVSYSDGILWSGEFYHPSAGYNTATTHHMKNKQGTEYGAWVAGYKLDPATDQPGKAPDYLLSIRDQIQGMAVTADSVILSRSYGRKNDSNLYRYAFPDLTGAPHQTVTVSGKQVPLWFLDETNQTAHDPVQVLPPMSEGIAWDRASRLYVLFESGANEYRFDGFNPLDRLAIVDLKAWTR